MSLLLQRLEGSSRWGKQMVWIGDFPLYLGKHRKIRALRIRAGWVKIPIPHQLKQSLKSELLSQYTFMLSIRLPMVFILKKKKSTKWWNTWKSYSFVMSTVVPQEDTDFPLIASISKVCLSNMDGFERWRQGDPPANNRETSVWLYLQTCPKSTSK